MQSLTADARDSSGVWERVEVADAAVVVGISEVMLPAAEVAPSAADWTTLLTDATTLLTDARTELRSACAVAVTAKTPATRAGVKRILASSVF